MGIGKKKSWEEQERQKLADLYRYHQKSMMQIAMSILHRKEDAEDAVQNSILAISRHMDKLGDIEDYRTKAYVQTVVRNAAIDRSFTRVSGLTLASAKIRFELTLPIP